MGNLTFVKRMINSEINSENYTAIPLFLEEVNIYLKERYANYQHDLNTNLPTPVNQNLMQFCNATCFLEKRKIKELRKYINETNLIEALNYEDRVQAEIILCKLVDLNLISFKVAIVLLPGYKKYFKMNQFRKHFKIINSFIRI